ncbi:hypothetical protein KKF55_05485 [Patescibacteria group bacterium]|nr:hypothetical protein [Patescibacteria group bacterium]
MNEIGNSSGSSQEEKAVLADLKATLAEVKEIMEVLSPIIENAEIHKEMLEAISLKIEKSHEGVKESRRQNTLLANELEKEREQVSTFLEEAKSYSYEGRKIVNALKLLEERGNKKSLVIENIRNELGERKKEATKLRRQIAILVKKAESLVEQAESLIEKITAQKGKADKLLLLIQKANRNVSSNTKEIKKLFTQGKKSFERIEKQANKVDGFHKKSQTYSEQIMSWNKYIFSDKGTKQQIDRIEKRIKSQQDIIESQLTQAASIRLCASLKDKVNELKQQLPFWKWSTFILVAVIAISNWALFQFSNLDGWEHIGIMSPIIFLLGFCSLEYVKTTRLAEEYNFKYVSAFGLPAYFELIDERDQKESLDYLIRTTNDIYTNPSESMKGSHHHTLLDYIVDAVSSIFSFKKINANKLLEEVLKEKVIEEVVKKTKV